jgi:hypothetical protein
MSAAKGNANDVKSSSELIIQREGRASQASDSSKDSHDEYADVEFEESVHLDELDEKPVVTPVPGWITVADAHRCEICAPGDARGYIDLVSSEDDDSVRSDDEDIQSTNESADAEMELELDSGDFSLLDSVEAKAEMEPGLDSGDFSLLDSVEAKAASSSDEESSDIMILDEMNEPGAESPAATIESAEPTEMRLVHQVAVKLPFPDIKPVILVAHELNPSDVTGLNIEFLNGPKVEVSLPEGVADPSDIAGNGLAVSFNDDGSYRFFDVLKKIEIVSDFTHILHVIRGQKRAREESEESERPSKRSRSAQSSSSSSVSEADKPVQDKGRSASDLEEESVPEPEGQPKEKDDVESISEPDEASVSSSSESTVMQRKDSPRRPWKGIRKRGGYLSLIQEVPQCFPDRDRRRCMRGRMIMGFTRVKLINIAWKVGAFNTSGLDPNFYKANWADKPKMAYARYVASWRGVNKALLCDRIWERLVDTGNVIYC